MKRIGLGLIVVVLVGAAVAYGFRGTIAVAMMKRQLAANMATDAIAALPDGIHVGLCGAGGPMPDPKRSGPCTAVIAGQKLFVFDTGTGGSRNMARMGLPMGRVEAVFLTHFHSDHIDGLGEFMLQRWINGAHQAPLPVYGGEGVEKVVAGFNDAYTLDSGYRTAHHGTAVAPPSGSGGQALIIPSPEIGSDRVVYNADGVEIRAFSVSHEPIHPALGYKISYKGRSVVLSGDTSKSAEVERMATGADLLVHEALSPELLGVLEDAAQAAGRANIAKIMDDILDYHTTPVEAAEVAQAAGVKVLLFAHIVPPLPLSAMEAAFTEGVGDAYDGKYVVGRDGTMISLPAGSAKVIARNRL